MECEICGNEIVGKRPNTKYCSSQCINTAKQNRAALKYLNGLGAIKPDNSITAFESSMALNSSDELRQIERENFQKIMDLKSEYGEKISSLKEEKQQQGFKIERLNDKIDRLEKEHAKELEAARNSATKGIVQSISTMPAAQSMLGMLATNVLNKDGKALGGVDNGFNEQEKQIIGGIRRMQPEAQTYLVQMLYVLYAKTNEEQMQIFTSLQAYLSEEVDSDDLP